MYDQNNVFAKILRNEIPCKKIYENDFSLAFHDITPKTPIHVLVIPKGSYISFDDFTQTASNEEIIGFFKAVSHVAHELELQNSGYRIIANHGENAGQEVPHFHVHICGGKPLNGLIP